MTTEIWKIKRQSRLFQMMMTQYLNHQKEMIDKFDQTNFSFLLTLPTYKNLSPIDLSNKIKSLLINMNRKIFTKRELNNNQKLQSIPVIEKNKHTKINHIHILIDRPDCQRVNRAKNPDQFIKDIFFKCLRKLRIVSQRLLTMTSNKCTQIADECFKKINSQFVVLNYITKEDRLLRNIDYANVNLTTSS